MPNDLTEEELDIVEHAQKCKLHVKKAGPHSGFSWYCFDCEAAYYGQPYLAAPIPVDHKSFHSNQAIKRHMMDVHGVHW